MLVLAVLVGALLRLVGLEAHGLWLDELFTARVVGRESWAGLVDELALDVHPPLYYALLRLWTGVAGTGDAALRLPSAVAGVAAIPLTAWLGRRFWGEGAGVLAALWLAVWPSAVLLDREARSNALLTTLALGATVALLRAEERRWRVAYGIATALLVWTHVFGFFVVLGQALYALSQFAQERWSTERLRQAAMPAFVGVASFAPWSLVLSRQVERFSAAPWYQPPDSDVLGWLLPELAGASGVLGALVLGWGLSLSRTRSRGPELVVAMVLGLVVVPVVVSWLVAPVLRPRNVQPLVPLLLMMAAGGYASLRPRASAWTLGLAVVSLTALESSWQRLVGEEREQWREAARLLVDGHQPGEPVWVNHPVLWWHYLPPGTVALTPFDEQADAAALASAWAPVLWGQRRAWVMVGHDPAEAAFTALSSLGEVELDEPLLGARVMRVRLRGWPVALSEAVVPDALMLEGGRVSFYWNATALLPTPAPPAGLPCRAVVEVRGTPAAGEPAKVVLGLGTKGGPKSRDVVEVGTSYALHLSPAHVFAQGEQGEIEVSFVNDGVALDIDGREEDRNAQVRSVSLRCGS